MLDCKNITSLRRTLSGGAKLLMGDQVLSGCAIKVSNSFTKAPVTEEEEKQNKAVAEIFDIPDEQLDMEPLVTTPIGTKLIAPEPFFIVEPGWEVCEGTTAEVIHAGYGGEVRLFGADADLLPGDLIVNGTIIGPDGTVYEAPFQVPGPGYKVGPDGAVISPTGGGEEDYCSLQELAGNVRADTKRVIDIDIDLDLDLDIPGLDMTWWVPIQEKINEITSLQSKLVAKVQMLADKAKYDPDGDVCKYRPEAQKLLQLVRDIQRILGQIRRVVQAVRTAVNTVKRVIRIIESIFMVGKAVKLALVYMMIKQMVLGLAQMIDTLARSILDANRILPTLIATLSAMIQACANQRGLEDGLSKEDCEALGGTWIEGKRKGDMGDGSAGRYGSDLDAEVAALNDDLDLYLKPGLALRAGDLITGGCVEFENEKVFVGTIPPEVEQEEDATYQVESFEIPGEGWMVCDEGASGQSDNATISEQEMRAILDAQIVDISACLTRIEDIQATADFIE